MRIGLVRVAALVGALGAFAAAGPGSPAFASGRAQVLLRAPAAQTQALITPAVQHRPLRARLRVADTNPRQLVGVLFDASGSTGDIALYFFDYGDGVVESSYQPLAMHGYRNAGTYTATVGVIDHSGHKAISARVTVHVRDGIPPVVRIDSPTPNQRVRLGGGGLLLKGRASDRHGVRKVALAIELVASKRHFNRHGGCIWYDGRRGLVLTTCARPVYFAAHFAGGHWRFRIPRKAKIPAGTYVVRVAAIDRAGNVSHFFTIALRTILPFRLVH